MDEQTKKKTDEPLELDKLSSFETFLQIVYGTGIATGLALLWLLESVRDLFFHLLDRLNLRPRARRASAFPPGRPRRNTSE